MSALTQIAEFEASTGSGAFPAINRADVATGLRERLANPKEISTKYVNLCGPAAFFYCLAQDDQDLYVKYVIDLYNTGEAKLGTLEVNPGSDCRHYRPDSLVAPVDWVALASLRDSENSALDFDSRDTDWGGITMPHSIRRWFKACGYDQIRDTTDVFDYGSPSDFKAMAHLYREGSRVCLLINAQMLSPDSETDWSLIPDHWVVLASDIPISNGKTSFWVFSWGKTLAFPEADIVSLTSNYYGYIAAMKGPIGDFKVRGGTAAG
jgi:hypothetical protein